MYISYQYTRVKVDGWPLGSNTPTCIKLLKPQHQHKVQTHLWMSSLAPKVRSPADQSAPKRSDRGDAFWTPWDVTSVTSPLCCLGLLNDEYNELHTNIPKSNIIWNIQTFHVYIIPFSSDISPECHICAGKRNEIVTLHTFLHHYYIHHSSSMPTWTGGEQVLANSNPVK